MNRLKKIRKGTGLTQQELADKIGTTKLTISNWENEKHSIKSDKAQKLAVFFDVSVEYLLGYKQAETMKELLVENQDKPLSEETKRAWGELESSLSQTFQPYEKMADFYPLYKNLNNIVGLANILNDNILELHGISRYYNQPIDTKTEKLLIEFDIMIELIKQWDREIHTIRDNLSTNNYKE